MKEYRPGCYQSDEGTGKCVNNDCDLRERCLMAEGEPMPPKQPEETALQKRGADGLGSGLGT